MRRLATYLKSARSSLVASALVGAIFAPLLWWATGHYEALLISERRETVEEQLELRSRALSYNFARVVGTLDAMVAVATKNADFDTLAQGLRANLPWVRAFQLVEDGVITHVFPLAGNEQALGYRLLDDPRPFIGGDVRRALATGRVTITGPVRLVQGGLGLIVRKPFERTGTERGRLAAVVCNTADLLQESLLGERELSSNDLDLALRVAGGDPFWGERAVFDNDHVMVRMPMADDIWELAARPTRGWDAEVVDPVRWFILTGLFIGALLLAFAALLARRHAWLTQTVSLRERQIEAQHGLLQAVVEGTNDAIFIKDSSGRFLMVNEACAHMFRRTRDEVVGQDDFAFLDEVDARQVVARDTRVRETGESQTLEEVVTVAGERRTFSSVKAPYRDASGHIIGIIGVSRDITEVKRAEEALRESELRSQRAQRLEALGTLAGGIAHDLNNALAPILIAVDALREERAHDDELLDMVGASARRAADMVKQLVGFARGKEGQRVPLQVGLVVSELRGLLNASFPKSVELQFHIESDLPLVSGDSTQVLQVLTNLCVNARDAMPSGGTLRVEARRCVVDAALAERYTGARAGSHVVVTVSDTGQGIPAELLDRIYTPFFSTKGAAKGTGLGLSTALGLVRGHDGFMVTESFVGSGTSVKVYLPTTASTADVSMRFGTTKDETHRDRSDRSGEPSRPFRGSGAVARADVSTDPSAAVRAVEREPRGSGEVILFVDDEAPILEVVSAVLGRHGYEVLVASSGEEGLRLAAERSADLRAVITDVHMPRMDGMAFVRALGEVLPGVPVGVVSGGLDEAEAESLSTLGVAARLDKPFSEMELTRFVRGLVS